MTLSLIFTTVFFELKALISTDILGEEVFIAESVPEATVEFTVELPRLPALKQIAPFALKLEVLPVETVLVKRHPIGESLPHGFHLICDIVTPLNKVANHKEALDLKACLKVWGLKKAHDLIFVA